MIGVHADWVRGGTLYVSPQRGVFDIISLSLLGEARTIPVRSAASGELVCLDVRSCLGLSSHPDFANTGSQEDRGDVGQH
jgi:hypothetical protein